MELTGAQLTGAYARLRVPSTVGDGKARKVQDFDTKERNRYEASRGSLIDSLSRTIWVKIAFLLHILATGAAALMYWMDKTGRDQVQIEGGLRW